MNILLKLNEDELHALFQMYEFTEGNYDDDFPDTIDSRILASLHEKGYLERGSPFRFLISPEGKTVVRLLRKLIEGIEKQNERTPEKTK